MSTQDLSVRIETIHDMDAVFVDKFDDNELWLSIRVRNGGAYVTLTFDQARQMMAAMQRVLDTQKETA